MQDEILGRNQAMKIMLGKAKSDEYNSLLDSLSDTRRRIVAAQFSEEKLKDLRTTLNEILFEIQKELMFHGKIDSRVPCASARKIAVGASNSID